MLGCVLGVEPAEEVTDDAGSAWGAPAGQSGTTYSAESNGSTDMMVVLFGASWGVELRVFGRVVWWGRAPEGWAFATAAWCCNSPPEPQGVGSMAGLAAVSSGARAFMHPCRSAWHWAIVGDGKQGSGVPHLA